ncbi:aldo/keto reductase [Planomicrobium sp. YIM 101495]|uniref:aldo/keto reductase n=1 Tax=Planomicrobium sp. YIM 101495 TaxID=2665160 RepID=UPI0012B7EAE8|nr:aldo/keto reductase [Planomicrobium sp. YIM 101495]MTD30105.1 aldo/keto reductase [Planomicrobium sp. YIM 101495]
MKNNRLGKSELEVSEIGLGCMSLPNDLEVAKSIIDEAFDHGIRFFDTADFYGKGENEQLVGAALKARRQDVILATKVGNEWQADSDEVSWNATKEYITEQVHNSLHRLGTDYIDLYQLHGGMITDDTEETIDAFETLKKEGLIRAYGISSIRPNVIRRFLDQADLASIMMQYSLLDRRPEEFLGQIEDAGVSVITRGSLAQGLLTNSGLSRAETKGNYMSYEKEQLAKTISDLTDVHGDLHALALHSVLHNPAVASAITGASSQTQLQDTLRAYHEQIPEETIQDAFQQVKQENYTQHRE